jgi:hypothetical protein
MALRTFFCMYSVSSVMPLVTARIYMESEEITAFLVTCSLLIHYEVTDCIPQTFSHFRVTVHHMCT